jgi:hypothetical protein
MESWNMGWGTHWNPGIWVGGGGHCKKPGTGVGALWNPGKSGNTLKCCKKDESLEFWYKASLLLIIFF